MNRKKRRLDIMNQNSTTKTFSRYGRPGWRGLGASVTIVIALVLMTGAAFAQPDGSPFAMPSTASQGVDAARQADSDRWAAQGEYYTAIWEAGSSANSARYSAMAASLGVGTGEAVSYTHLTLPTTIPSWGCGWGGGGV